MTNRNRCLDTEIGKLIHAYELYALSEEDNDKLEAHLIKCDYCFQEVQDFDRAAEFLRANENVRKETALALAGSAGANRSLISGVRGYLWPDIPLVFRPAVVIILVLLLMYPAYLGLFPAAKRDIGSAVTIHLMANRTAESGTFAIPIDKDIILSFIYYAHVPDHKYTVRLTADGDVLLFEDKLFHDFDEYGMAAIVLPAESIRPGVYSLEITDLSGSGSASSHEQVYKFILK